MSICQIIEPIATLVFMLGGIVVVCSIIIVCISGIYYKFKNWQFNRKFLRDTWRRAMELEMIDRQNAKKVKE